ncbi:hypothetical protein Sjap_014909 [Stephania japonica]|uniref:Uncharacterized protein n=1 Tax=Stephania japonica TaxID=461633 RepID=A0AAP0IIF9_9MAGN
MVRQWKEAIITASSTNAVDGYSSAVLLVALLAFFLTISFIISMCGDGASKERASAAGQGGGCAAAGCGGGGCGGGCGG